MSIYFRFLIICGSMFICFVICGFVAHKLNYLSKQELKSFIVIKFISCLSTLVLAELGCLIYQLIINT